MEIFDQIFTLIASDETITFNFDILETGLINIIALIIILIYVGRDFLGSALEQRKNEIITNVQDAEERLNEANRRLNEAQKQLSQANIIIDEIKNDTINTKKMLLKADVYQSKKDLTTRFNRALATFCSKERQIFLEVKQQIILLVLKRVIVRAQQTFSTKKRATRLINETINRLEGDLL